MRPPEKREKNRHYLGKPVTNTSAGRHQGYRGLEVNGLFSSFPRHLRQIVIRERGRRSQADRSATAPSFSNHHQIPHGSFPAVPVENCATNFHGTQGTHIQKQNLWLSSPPGDTIVLPHPQVGGAMAEEPISHFKHEAAWGHEQPAHT
jgi:hypothetical protein